MVVDAPYEDAVDYMQQIRRDARFAGLPVLAVCEREEDLVGLFRHGASDVLVGENRKETLAQRLRSAIRFGKRRRLADKILAESRMWLRQQINKGGLAIEIYSNYLQVCSDALAVRGLDLWEMRLEPESFGIAVGSPEERDEINTTLLSIADATSRDEDLVCLVRDIGPVAVLKNEAGITPLQKADRSNPDPHGALAFILIDWPCKSVDLCVKLLNRSLAMSDSIGPNDLKFSEIQRLAATRGNARGDERHVISCALGVIPAAHPD
ncbi:hypothetical protein QW131_09240 [Roseibium salinum]|nr:hypothetical protein [Roseibium salinum]